ncbi:hypothetical protein OUZ56_028409 [Daphnia magna]|uniref:Uncharacterized protein n=1 Tax=Daphnia magna TaxID=35525 RepID=A0ABR0B3S9_9CRUS|nr:hypothetical protein OUZ56_028409 [Daphnia magna]
MAGGDDEWRHGTRNTHQLLFFFSYFHSLGWVIVPVHQRSGYDIINDLFMICWDPLWIPSLQSVYLLFATMMDLFFTSHGLHKSRGITSPFVAPSELRPSTSSIVVLLLDHGRRRPKSIREKKKKKKKRKICAALKSLPRLSSDVFLPRSYCYLLLDESS